MYNICEFHNALCMPEGSIALVGDVSGLSILRLLPLCISADKKLKEWNYMDTTLNYQ